MNLAPDCLRINGKRVIIELDPPPIPDRGFDYRAHFAHGDELSPTGYGATPRAAVDDLKSWDDLTMQEVAQ
jgi:hypothetical protein